MEIKLSDLSRKSFSPEHELVRTLSAGPDLKRGYDSQNVAEVNIERDHHLPCRKIVIVPDPRLVLRPPAMHMNYLDSLKLLQ